MRARARARAHVRGSSCRRPARPRSAGVRAREDTPGTDAPARSCRGSRSQVPRAHAAVPLDQAPSCALQSAQAFELCFEPKRSALELRDAFAKRADDGCGCITHEVLIGELRARLLQILAGLREAPAEALRLGGRVDKIRHRNENRELPDESRGGLRRGAAALEELDARNTRETLEIRAVPLDAGAVGCRRL